MKNKLTAAMLRGYPDIMTPDDLQNVLKIGRSKAYNLLKTNEIKSVRIGANYRIPKPYLLDYINKNTCVSGDNML